MTPTSFSSSSSRARRAPSRPELAAPARSRRGRPARARPGGHDPTSALGALAPARAVASASASLRGIARRRKLGRLGAYTTKSGRAREVIAARAGDGCVLVVDRDALTRGDRRLVARLYADEPTENAALVCAHYLSDACRGRCRRVSVEDLSAQCSAAHEQTHGSPTAGLRQTELVGGHADGEAWAYRLQLVGRGGEVEELRWCRHSSGAKHTTPQPVRLREVIGALESYEPACELTLAALAAYREQSRVSTSALRVQLERMRESPIVLNRGLRQAVLAAIERDGLSLSEIALRCGRVKRDSKGNRSGETSWLARRLGILAESGADRHTPWVHSDVLALIAREGLGISPREVELG
jgi:hypothetical protein